MEKSQYLVFGTHEAIKAIGEFELGNLSEEKAIALFEDDFYTSTFVEFNSTTQLADCLMNAFMRQDYSFITKKTYELLK